MQKRSKLKKIKKLSAMPNVSFPYDCDEGCDLTSGELCEACKQWAETRRQTTKRKGDKDHAGS